MATVMALKCPTCDGIIEILEPEVGKQVDCPDCEALFVVASLDPLELTYALDMEEEGWFEDEPRQP